jgi:hypothetical protein
MNSTREITAPDGTVKRTTRTSRFILARVAEPTRGLPMEGIPGLPRRIVIIRGSDSEATVRAEDRRLRNRGHFDQFIFDMVEDEVVR